MRRASGKKRGCLHLVAYSSALNGVVTETFIQQKYQGREWAGEEKVLPE